MLTQWHERHSELNACLQATPTAWLQKKPAPPTPSFHPLHPHLITLLPHTLFSNNTPKEVGVATPTHTHGGNTPLVLAYSERITSLVCHVPPTGHSLLGQFLLHILCTLGSKDGDLLFLLNSLHISQLGLFVCCWD